MYPFDHKLSIWLTELLLSKGIEVYTNHSLQSISAEESRLVFKSESGETVRETDWIIYEPTAHVGSLAKQTLSKSFDTNHLSNSDGVHIVGTVLRDQLKVITQASLDAMAESVSRQILSGNSEDASKATYQHIAEVRLPISPTCVRDIGLNHEGQVIFNNEHSGFGLLADNLSSAAQNKTQSFWRAVWY